MCLQCAAPDIGALILCICAQHYSAAIPVPKAIMFSTEAPIALWRAGELRTQIWMEHTSSLRTTPFVVPELNISAVGDAPSSDQLPFVSHKVFDRKCMIREDLPDRWLVNICI